MKILPVEAELHSPSVSTFLCCFHRRWYHHALIACLTRPVDDVPPLALAGNSRWKRGMGLDPLLRYFRAYLGWAREESRVPCHVACLPYMVRPRSLLVGGCLPTRRIANCTPMVIGDA